MVEGVCCCAMAGRKGVAEEAGVHPHLIHTMGSSAGSMLAIRGCANDELCRDDIAGIYELVLSLKNDGKEGQQLLSSFIEHQAELAEDREKVPIKSISFVPEKCISRKRAPKCQSQNSSSRAA